MNLSEHFTLEEFQFSTFAVRHNITNEMNDIQTQCAKNLCNNVLEKIRMFYGLPIHIDSGYRCPILNSLIGGAKYSQHILGEAADIIIPTITSETIFNDIRLQRIDVPYDEVILEFGWVHISFSSAYNRKEALVANRYNGVIIYKEIA